MARCLYTRLLAGLLIFFAFSSAQATYILSAPPRETPEKGAAMYQPLADLLSEVLAEPVRYQHPGNWGQYARDVQNGNYDIVFDGPHFASWRMVNIQHTPLVTLAGNLHFFVFARTSDSDINGLDDLKFGKVCAIASPNLTAVMVMAQFDGVSSPNIIPAKGGMKGVFDRFAEGDCRAAVLRDDFVTKLDEEKLKDIKPIFESPSYPNQGITVGPKVPTDKHNLLIEALTSERGKKAAQALLERFGDPDKQYFIKVDPARFQGLNKLLEGVVWGW